MSDDTTPTPADMPNRGPAQDQNQSTGASDWSDDVDWKAEARKWEQRAKANRAAADAASKTAAERVADRIAELEKRAIEAEARAVRRSIALEHSLSAEDATLLDAITDEKVMRQLAQRLASEQSDRKKQGNHVPREGNNQTPASDPMREFARKLFAKQD